MFSSTKIIELGSCAFRQPEADSHCRFLHGYRLTAKFWFEAKHLDQNNWVVDFGGLKSLKKTMQDQFDHTTCISRTDPKADMFKKLRDAGVCDLRMMDGVGIEKFAEWCHGQADAHVRSITNKRCRCVKVEVFEHENNSAIYSLSNTDEDWLDVPVEEEDVEEPEEDEFSVPGAQSPILTEQQMGELMDEVVKSNKDAAKPAAINTNDSKVKNKWVNPDSKNTWGL